MKTPVFNSRKVGKLLEKYVRHPHSHTLRQDIMERVYPLIDAAITRKRLFHLRDDLRQECALKVLKALSKYRAGRGSAFAFVWTIVCNSLKTHGKRMSKGGLSLEEENIHKEAEAAAIPVFQGPEYQYLQKIIAKAIDQALASRELRVFQRDKDKKALAYIRQTMLSGDLFTKRSRVQRVLEKMGIKRKNTKFLMDYVIVSVRARLYSQKDFLHEIATRQTGTPLPKKFDL